MLEHNKNLFDKHSDILSLRELADSTVATYLSYLTQIILWVEENLSHKDISAITWEQIRSTSNILKTSAALAAAQSMYIWPSFMISFPMSSTGTGTSMKCLRSILMSFFQQSQQQGRWIPSSTPFRTPNTKPRFLFCIHPACASANSAACTARIFSGLKTTYTSRKRITVCV